MQPTLIRDQLEYWLLRPDARLASHVRCYFVVDAGASAYEHDELLLPDGYAEIVFTLDAGYQRWPIGEQARRSVMSRSYLIGGRSHSVMTSGARRLKLVGVKLEPQALRGLIRVPLNEFQDATLELRELNHPGLLALEEAVANASSVGEIAATLDRFFLRHLDAGANDPAVEWMVRNIRGARGALSIARSRAELALDERTVGRRFAAGIGMTPKRYARIVRFKHNYHALLLRQADPARAGHLEGFYDQSHFIRDFRHFTGTTPMTLLARQVSSSTAVTDHLLRGDLQSAQAH
jgi:AraC-like DNA-binding protein